MVYLDKNLITTLPTHSTMVYVAIRMTMRNNQTEAYYTFGKLCFDVGLSITQYWKDQTQYGLLYMMNENNNLIKLKGVDEHSKGIILDTSNLQLDTQNSYFISVPEEDIYRITGSEHPNGKKMGLLKYYLILLGAFNHSKDIGEYSGKVCSRSISYLAEEAQISERTAMRYNEDLVELGLLYIHKSDDFIKTHDRITQITNVYSRAEDKELCDKYASEYENKYGYESKQLKSKQPKKESDRNRALAQMYNQMVKYGRRYDEETTEEIKQYIYMKNEYYKKELEVFEGYDDNNEIVQQIKRKIRDTSVFEQ